MLHKALEQFLTDVFWDEPDFLRGRPAARAPATSPCPSPQFLPRAEVYVVTTPQPAAQRVAQRAAFMAEKVNLEVKGVIENMSWFTGDDGQRYEIFGAGGGRELAERLDVPLLGQIPLVPELREGGDAGRPIVAVDPDSEAAGPFRPSPSQIDVELAPTRRYNPGLKLLGRVAWRRPTSDDPAAADDDRRINGRGSRRRRPSGVGRRGASTWTFASV